MRFRVSSVLLCLVAICAPALAQKAAHPSTSAGGYIVSAHETPMPHVPAARLVARVNGADLTDRDLLREMYAIFPYARQHDGGFPKAMEADIRKGALKMIEFEELVYQEATRQHFTIAPARLATSEKQFRQRFETPQQYQYFLQSEAHGSQDVLRAKIKRSLLIEDFLKQQVTDKSGISDAEAKAFYKSNPQAFKIEETYTVQTITVLSPNPQGAKQPAHTLSKAEADKQMRARAEAELKQAKATKNYEEFGLLAEKISDDDYRVMMGDHRAVTVKDLPALIVAAVSKMQVGQVSDPILVDGAYTIVRLNAHSPARTQTFAEAAPSLKGQMQHNKSERLRHDLDARLRKNARIEEL
jgi:peptidyl-prolyl cis-trans isomerase SurA